MRPEGKWLKLWPLLRSTHLLSMTLQTDLHGAISVAYLQIVFAQYNLKVARDEKGFQVVKTSGVDRQNRWDPATSYDNLETDCYKLEASCGANDKPLEALALTLITRLLREFQRYFENVDKDRDIAMMCNPLNLDGCCWCHGHQAMRWEGRFMEASASREAH